MLSLVYKNKTFINKIKQCFIYLFIYVGFDGFDWDIEGNDDMNSKYNVFTTECLDLMGEMSQLAKKDGYIVAMAPAESYLDPTTTLFDR